LNAKSQRISEENVLHNSSLMGLLSINQNTLGLTKWQANQTGN